MRTSILLPMLLAGCGPKAPTVPTTPAPAAAPAVSPVAQKVLSALDPTTDPCVDFYQYACGGWLAETELPSDKPSWTRSFSVISESNRTFLKDLLERAAADPAAGDEGWGKMGRFYGACMDEGGVEAAELTGVQPLLDAVAGLKSHQGLMPILAQLHAANVDALFGAEVEGDFKDPQLTILHLGQGGLSLPDRDYYLKDDEESVALLDAYNAHIATMLQLSGAEEAVAKEQARQIVAFEKALAELHRPRADMRDPTKVYNKIDRAGLDAQIKDLDWGAWLEVMGTPDVTDINVDAPDVMAGMGTLVASTDLDVLRVYLRWQTLHAVSTHLPKAYVDASFSFYGKQVYGQQENEVRWKRCVRATDSGLGEVVGRYFIEEKFAGSSKEKAVSMIEGIQAAFEQQLPALEWMDDETRARAIEKKNSLVNMIGYPDKWRVYDYEVAGDNHLANILASRAFETQDAMDRVGKPTDSTKWFMSPPAVNAYYHPLYNQMVFPAGILQPPFFDAGFPMAMNFGGIGMVMGHELTHGFDDQGRMFDPQGRMVEWWAPEVSARFEERAACVEEQFNGYEVAPGLPVNGKLTLGENIADLGGLKSSYNAFKAWEAANPAPAAVPGLTDDQLLFVSFAQGWCSVSSPEYEKMLVLSNSHSPPKFRVNGPVANLPEFHEVFSCPVGAPLHPEEFCTIW